MSKYELPFASTLFINELTIDGYKIDPSGATLNQVLKYDGTAFVPGNSGGAADLGNWTFTSGTATVTGSAGIILKTSTGNNLEFHRADNTKIFDMIATSGASTFYNNLTVQDTIFVNNGSAANPSISFTSSTDMGMYKAGSRSLKLQESTGGYGIEISLTNAVKVTGALTTTGALLTIDGSNAAPSYTFTSDTDTGIYSASANNLGFATGGGQRVNIDGGTVTIMNAEFAVTNGISRFYDGSAGSPGITFQSDQDTGMYRNGANDLAWAVGGAKKMELAGSTLYTDNIDSLSGVTLGLGAGSTNINIGPNSGTGYISLVAGSGNITLSVGGSTRAILSSTELYPNTNNAISLGDSAHAWKDGYFAGIVTASGGYVGPSIGTSTSALHPLPTGTGELLCTGLVTDVTGASGVDITLANDGYLTAGAAIVSLIGDSFDTLHSLPTGVDEIVSTDATQTLINKTIDATSNTIINLGVALFSFVDFANNHTGATLNAGNFSMGAIFYLVTPGSCTGGRFYWAGGAGAVTVKVSLWDSSNTRVKNASVAVNAAGIYSVTFSSPHIINDIYQVYTIAMWEDSGTKFTTFDTPANDIRLLPNNNRTSVVTTPTAGGSGYANGKTIVAESDIFVGGDAMPDPASILTFPNKSPIEAIII